MRRAMAALWPWAAALIAIVAVLAWAVDPSRREAAANIATFLGMALLAVPAIRLNEQGRLIARIQKLEKGIDEARAALDAENLPDSRRREHRQALDERRRNLAGARQEVISGKGSWTPLIHLTLYGGYVLLLSAAVARVLG